MEISERLRIYPASDQKMEALIAAAPDPELQKAYGEMLALSRAHPEQRDWYAAWIIETREGTPVGDLCFKGLSEDGAAEIGYGIDGAFQGRGYATEALRAALSWAFRHPALQRVEAETDPENAASQRVLAKCGFLPTGETGEEGPRFFVTRERLETPVLRRFRPQDYQAVCDFLVELNREDRTHINWNWARFEWMYEHPDCDKSLLGSIGLWTVGDRVVGAAIYDMYFGEAFCGVLPDYAPLYPAVLDYAWRELRDENGLGIALCDGCEAERAAALAAGFSPAEQTETTLVIALEQPFPIRLPKGLRFASPDPIADSEALQWLFWRGFNHGEDRAEFELQKQPPSGLRPHFDPRLNVAAADESGELAALCGIWYLPGTDYAYVEPVCTVPGWRGKGLGRAVVSEALNRARSFGAKRAYVISDQAFYYRLGFEFDRHYTYYWRKA